MPGASCSCLPGVSSLNLREGDALTGGDIEDRSCEAEEVVGK